MLGYLLTIQKIIQVFDELKIAYLIGGSVASSVHGIHRFTNDVDFVVDLKEEEVAALVAALESDFYVDTDMISGHSTLMGGSRCRLSRSHPGSTGLCGSLFCACRPL